MDFEGRGEFIKQSFRESYFPLIIEHNPTPQTDLGCVPAAGWGAHARSESASTHGSRSTAHPPSRRTPPRTPPCTPPPPQPSRRLPGPSQLHQPISTPCGRQPGETPMPPTPHPRRRCGRPCDQRRSGDGVLGCWGDSDGLRRSRHQRRPLPPALTHHWVTAATAGPGGPRRPLPRRPSRKRHHDAAAPMT